MQSLVSELYKETTSHERVLVVNAILTDVRDYVAHTGYAFASIFLPIHGLQREITTLRLAACPTVTVIYLISGTFPSPSGSEPCSGLLVKPALFTTVLSGGNGSAGPSRLLVHSTSLQYGSGRHLMEPTAATDSDTCMGLSAAQEQARDSMGHRAQFSTSLMFIEGGEMSLETLTPITKGSYHFMVWCLGSRVRAKVRLVINDPTGDDW
ncbi:hypothetical protein QBC37DRAFT_414996 [Rhypophila decipiens]|uniref:Uncharacterized protein n=1 Tax=Rhypophila decipiens TaxID=261697 RepID=A0AAN6YDP0_9PEZI|nr:hypothetical protein QBC37DRAFT_414996 [Rhypophila decipiens]